MILCAKPGDGHWATVDAGVAEVEDGVRHHEEKPHLVGMRVVGEGVGLGLGLGVGEGQC
jgi:predicted NUDIX family NTP pyrophosphohydrolase